MHICWNSAGNGERSGCGDTRRRLASASSATGRRCCLRRRHRMRRARSAPPRSVRCRWCATARTTTRCPPPNGHREVPVKGYVHEVVIDCGSEAIARHRRSYEREDMIFDPLHYLALLEEKIRALDQAAPLAGWELPECFLRLRRLLEARMSKHGKREYVQVLRLLETFTVTEVTYAVQDALHLGTISLDAV